MKMDQTCPKVQFFLWFYELETFPGVVKKNYKTLLTQIGKESLRSLHKIIWNLSFQG